MANTRRTRSYRGSSRRTSGSGALFDTVKSTITQFSGDRGRSGRSGRRSSGGGGGLASQASGFIGGLLSGGGQSSRTRGRAAGRRRR